MRRVVGDEVFEAVYEVYYDVDGNVTGWTDDPASPMHYPDVDTDGFSLRADIERFLRACDKPTLDWDTGKEIE